jgi:hypothetical protein
VLITYRLAGMTFLTGGFALLAAGFALMTGSPTAVAAQPSLEVEPFEDFACLDCHTDRDRLEELAIAEEPSEESLSSGPG